MKKNYTEYTENQFKERVKYCIDMLFDEEGVKDKSIKVGISKRMTNGFGYFKYNRKKEQAILLQFSFRLLDGRFTTKYVDQIILHEVIHYLVFMKKHYNEGHGSTFKAYCKKHKCHIFGATSDPEDSNNPNNKKVKEDKYTVSCLKCDMSFGRDVRSKIIKEIKTYNCKCGSKLKVIQNH